MHLRQWLPLGLLALALTLVGFASRTARADTPEPQGDVVEEVRYGQVGDLLVERRVMIDRSVQPDTAGAADRLTGLTADGAGVTAQYLLNPWKWSAEALPVPVSLNPAGAPAGAPPQSWIDSAARQWSAVTSTFRFTYTGTTTAGLGACIGDGTSDGINTIGFVKGMEAGVLGQTCTLSTRGGRLMEFDMELSGDTNWGAGDPIESSQYDLPSTILHEMGHAAGLAHPCEPPHLDRCTTAEVASVMYYSIGHGKTKRTLQPDDMAALRAQYPGGGAPPTPTPAPTPVPIPPYTRNFEVLTAGLAHD